MLISATHFAIHIKLSKEVLIVVLISSLCQEVSVWKSCTDLVASLGYHGASLILSCHQLAPRFIGKTQVFSRESSITEVYNILRAWGSWFECRQDPLFLLVYIKRRIS